MPLPILESPKYTVTIPSIKKTIEFRPYLVKEEKILMLAMESEDEKQMISAVKGIIRACTFDKVNPDDLTTVDLEYVFLKLRCKSVGETVNISLKCLTPECNGSIEAEINLESIEPTSLNPNISNRVKLTDKIGMTLKPVSVRSLSRLGTIDKKTKADQVTDLVIASIESIYDENGVYRAEDHTIEELTQFVDSLSTPQLKQIQTYVESLPRLSKDIAYTCSTCKMDHRVTLTGLQSFFV
jgi:hypothetical protein